MDLLDQLNRLFDVLGKTLPEAGVPFLMIGGHAVNYYGYTRATADIDFMITSDDVPAVRDVMRTAGFLNVSEGNTVIFFSCPGLPIRVDFLPVDFGTMRQLLTRSIEVPYGRTKIRIPCLNDLLAMKLFAIQNGPTRRKEKDVSDVIQLAFENGLDCEVDLKPLCDRFASAPVYTIIADRLKEMNDA